MTVTFTPPIPLREIRELAEQLARMFEQRHRVKKDQLPMICAAAGEILSAGLVKKFGAFRVRPYIERSFDVAPSIIDVFSADRTADNVEQDAVFVSQTLSNDALWNHAEKALKYIRRAVGRRDLSPFACRDLIIWTGAAMSDGAVAFFPIRP